MAKKSHGPSIKAPRKYERMREQGMSKEKAARVANAARGGKAPRRGGKAPAYEDWSRQDLYDKARKVGIPGRSTMSKQELIDALRHH